MAKKRLPLSEEGVKAIKDYINSPKRKLIENKQYFDNLERLLVDRKIPKTYVSFEVLKALHNGIENGFTKRLLDSARSDIRIINFLSILIIIVIAFPRFSS